MGNVIPLIFEGARVRVIQREGNPWFVLADVCRVLDIGNPTRAAERLDPDEQERVDISDRSFNIQGAKINDLGAVSGNNVAIIINESGFYSLTFTSRKEAAKRFRRWVTGEVLPSIRRTGSYDARPVMVLLENPERLRALLLEINESESVRTAETRA